MIVKVHEMIMFKCPMGIKKLNPNYSLGIVMRDK